MKERRTDARTQGRGETATQRRAGRSSFPPRTKPRLLAATKTAQWKGPQVDGEASLGDQKAFYWRGLILALPPRRGVGRVVRNFSASTAAGAR